MPGRYYIKTFGCQMNEYDSTRMGDVLGSAAGLQPTDNPAEADVLLMNTCSVREKAEDKVYSLLGEWRDIKKLKPHVLIGVGGCVASQEGDAITKRAPYVDLVFGPQTLHRHARRTQAHRPLGGGRVLPRNREVRQPAGAARGRVDGFRFHHGRLQQVLHFLRGAVHAR